MTDQLRTLEEEFADDPSNSEVVEELLRRLWEEQDWRAVLALYDEYAAEAPASFDYDELLGHLRHLAQDLEEGEEKGQILLAIGDLCLGPLDAYEEGMEAYQNAFKAYPLDVTPLERAREVYESRQNWVYMLDIYGIELKVTQDEEQRAALYLEMAQINADKRGEFEEALRCLDEVDDLGVDAPFAEQLRDFYSQGLTVEHGIREMLALAEEALNDESEEIAAEALIEATQLEYDRYGGTLEEALNLAHQALEIAPGHPDVQLIAEELSKQVEAVEPDSVNGERGAAVPVGDAGEEHNDEQDRSADLEEQSGAEEDEPAEVAAEPVSEVEEAQQGQFEESEARDEPRSVEAFFEAAPQFDGTLEEAKQVLDKDRTDLAALAHARSELLEQGDMAGLVDVLEDSVRYFRKQDGEWEVMTELANLYWLELGDDERAEYYFKRLKLLDPEHPDVFKFYEAYYESEGDWRKLFSLLAGRLEQLEDREEYRIIVEQLSDIAEGDLESPEKAIDVWKKFCRKFPDDDDARMRVRHLYEDHGKWNALVDHLKEEARRLADEDDEDNLAERVRLLEEMAHIYRVHLNLDTMVMNIMAEIMELDPDHPTAFGQLRDLYEENRRFNDLAQLLADASERAVHNDNVGTAVGQLLEVADIWEDRLNNQTQAIPYLERIVEIAPEEAGVRDRLREIYEKRRDFESLFDLRLQETRLLGTVEREEELEELLELARQQLRDEERAARVLEALLELRDDDLELLEALQQVRTELEDWSGLAEIVERKSELLSGEGAVDALATAAQLHREKLGDNDEARRLWQGVRSEAPHREDAFEALAEIAVEEGDLDGLEKLYLDADAAEDLFDILGILADGAAEVAVELHRRQVRVAEEELADDLRVIEALELLCEAVPDPDHVRRELLDWYRRVDDLDSEIQTRQILLDGELDDEEIYEEMLVLAELEERRGQPEVALGWATKSFQLLPGGEEAFPVAEDLARKSGMLSLLVDTALSVAEEVEDQVIRESIWADCARIQWRDLGEYEAAVERYERLREQHPEEFEFMEALDELYALTEQAEKRIEVLRTQIDLLRERGAADVDVVDQLSKIADVQRTHLDQVEAARDTYSKILDLQPDHLGAVRGLKELCRQEERWNDVVDYLLREIPLAPFDSQEAVWRAKLELADLYRKELDDLHEALRYYGEILGENPEYEEALQAVRGLLAEDGLARDAAILLEPIFRDLQQAGPLVEALEARLRVSQDPFEEQEILDELIPLCAEDLEDTERAFEYARRQFEIDPERDDIWLRFEQLGAKLNKWELIEEMFTQESPLEGHESPTRYDLLRHLAAIREHQLQRTEDALEAWERLYEYDEFDTAVLEALDRLYRKTEQTSDLVDILRARAELVDIVDDRISLLLEAGQLLADDLDDVVTASQVFREVLDHDPENERAVDRLMDLLRIQQRWHDLDALLNEQADQTLDPEKRREFLRQLAMLRYEELDDKPGSISIICDLLDDDPGDDEVLDFARRVDSELAEEDANVDLRLQLARTLEPIYRMRGEYDRLDELLQVRLEVSEDEFQQVEILDELVELRQKRLSDPESALIALKEAVVLQPDDAQRRAKLLEMATGLQLLPEAVETLEEAAQGADPFVALDIWKRLGKIADQRLDDPSRAIEYYEQAHSLDEADAQILEALQRLFEATGQSEELCHILREQARYADPDRRMALLRRIGTLQHHVLERPIDAIEIYQQILEMEPADLGSIEALEGLYREQGEYFDLVELFRRKVEVVDDGAPTLDVLLGWAEVAEEQLQDVPQTIDVYRRVLDAEPEHRRALAELDRLLEAEAQWAEWTEVARRRLEGPDGNDPEVRLDLQLRLARVYIEELFEIEPALQLYRDVLEQEAYQPDAVTALEELASQDSWLEEVAVDLTRIYSAREQFENLVALYERRRDHAMDPELQAEFDFERGKLFRDRLEDTPQAMRAFASAWRTRIDGEKYREALVQLGTRDEQWELLIELLDEALDAVVDPDLSEELHLMLARLWRDVLDEPMEAESHLRQVLERHPLHRDAFQGLLEILEARERWHDLVDLLEQRHDAVIGESEQDAIGLLMTIADIQEEYLGDGYAAVDTLQRVRALDERHSRATERLEELYRNQERWEDLGQFYEERAERAPVPSERLEAELALAELCRGPLRQVERAIELYGDALSIEAEHEVAVACLEEIFQEGEAHSVRAAELLEPLYRERRDDRALVGILQARADASNDPAEKADLLRELLDLLDDTVDAPHQAWRAAAELFMSDPTDRLARERLWKLTARAGAWGELSQIYEWTLENNFEIDDSLRCNLRLDLARVAADRVGDLIEGLESAQAALRLDPENEEAVRAVEGLMIRQKAWQDLAEFYRNRADFAADEERARFWYERLAVLYEDVIGDVDSTVDVYARLLEIAPGEEAYRGAMERILTTVGRWYDLADIYRQRIAGAMEPEVVLENKFALASLLENELHELEEAIEHYAQILEEHREHSDTIRALEGIRRDLETRDDPGWEASQKRVIEALLEAYDESRSWRRVDDLLGELVDFVDDPVERVEILVEKAQLLLRSTADDIERIQALSNLARAFCMDPHNEEIDELIEVLAEDLEAWERIIPILLESLGTTDDVDRQGLILAKVANIYEERIGDKESAVAAYQQSVEISAESELALEKLQQLYGEMEKWEPLVDILERRLEAIYDPDRQQELRKRIARIYDEVLGESQKALPLYVEIRREEPTELSHLVVMERLYDDVGDHQALEELLLDKLQIVDADALRAQTLKRLAEVRRDHLGRVDDAIACFHDALEIVPGDVEALEALIEVYRDDQRWPDLLEVLRSRRDESDDREQINEIELEMGDVLFEEVGDLEGALEHYGAVLERNRENYMARGAVFRLLDETTVQRQAAEVLTEVYRAGQEWDDLEALYQRLIESSEDPAFRAEQYLALATMQDEELGLAIKAFATLSEAVLDVPQVESLRQELERVAGVVGAEDDLVAIYEDALAGGVDDPDVARALHLVVGRGYTEQLEDFQGAIPHFEAVLEVDEFDEEALDWLDKIYQAQRDWENLIRILETKMSVASGDDLLQTTFQLGYLREVVEEDFVDAFDLYRKVLLEVPGHDGAVEGLERLCEDNDIRPDALDLLEPTYREEGHWSKLTKLLAMRLEMVEYPSERAELHREIAELYFEKIDDLGQAFHHWCRAFAEDPHDGDVQIRLEDIAASHDLYSELVDHYSEIIDEIDDPVRQVELAEKAGRWAMERLDDSQRAASLYRRVLEVQPEHSEALEILERVARDEGDNESLAAVLAARVQSTFDEAEQVELYTELASVRLGIEDYDGAIDAFEQLLILEGDDVERLETLAHLQELTERWDEKVRTLERLLAFQDDDMMRFDTLTEIGTICLEHLEDYGKAKRNFTEAMQIDPDDRDVMQAMEGVYTGLEEWDELEELLEKQLEAVGDDEDEERVRLYIGRAELRYQSTSDVEGAIADYRAAFAIRDDHAGVISALGDLYRSEKRWEDLIDLLTRQISRADSETGIEYLLEMAAVAHEELGALDRAAEFCVAVLEEQPFQESALDRLEAIYREQHNWQGVVQILDRRMEGAHDEPERLEWLRERARTLHEDAGELAEAAQTYRQLLAANPEDDELVSLIEKLYEKIDDGEGLYEMLAHRIDYSDDAQRQVELYLEMGEVARKYFGGGQARIEALEAARQIGGDDLDVVEPLLDAYIEGDRLDLAEPLLESVIETLTADRKMKEVVRFYHLRGKLAEQQGDLSAAQSAYEEAHRLDATYVPNLLSLGKLFFNQQAWEEAKKIFQILLLHQMNIKDDADKVEVYFHLGAIREQGGDEKGARDMYKRALRVDANHEDSKAAMAALDA